MQRIDPRELMQDPRDLAEKIVTTLLADFGVQSLQEFMQREEWTFYDKERAPAFFNEIR